MILAGMSANLCVESHMRELLERGFEVLVVQDATAAAQVAEGDGYAAALVNFRFMANAVMTTAEVEQAVKKVTKEIAGIRHVPMGHAVISPPAHTAFSTPIEMMDFIAKLRELSEGKPVGYHIIKRLALGADVIYSARAMMMALGCIQARKRWTSPLSGRITMGRRPVLRTWSPYQRGFNEYAAPAMDG